MKLNNSFEIFLSRIEPTGATQAGAISAHKTLRDRLATDPEFAAYHIETFLSGSYRRSTAVQPIKDVDIVVIINANPNKDTPRQILAFLKRVLDKYYATKTAPQRRSIRIDLADISMDVIPAVAPYGADREIQIPDCTLQEWIWTNPKGHIDWTKRLNEATKDKPSDRGRFVPLVKMAKWWKRVQLPDAKRPKGFTLECLAGWHHDPSARDWADGFIAFLERVTMAYAAYKTRDAVPPIPDPGLPGKAIPTGLTPREFKAFLAAAEISLALSRRARDAATAKESADLWRQVFGDRFPTSDDDEGTKATEPDESRGPSIFTRSVHDIREAPPFA